MSAVFGLLNIFAPLIGSHIRKVFLSRSYGNDPNDSLPAHWEAWTLGLLLACLSLQAVSLLLFRDLMKKAGENVRLRAKLPP
jgi:hypothetical protein